MRDLSEEWNYIRYHKRFRWEPLNKVTGEATPTYMCRLKVPKRIQAYNPQMKLIVLLRNPLDRAYSNWNMEKNRFRENKSFYEAVKSEQERISLSPMCRKTFSYITRGFYSWQINNLWKYFPKEQVMIIKSEEFRSNTLEVVNSVFRYLGIKEIDSQQLDHCNKVLAQADIPKRGLYIAEYDSAMSSRAKDYLLPIFYPEVKRIEQMLGWDCGDWLE